MRCFVTATDTDAGKTVACAWLMLHSEAKYWKPVQAGLEETDEASVRALTELGDNRFHQTAFSLPEPLSPHESARRAGITIDPAKLALPDNNGPLIVEGAGGLMVPLNDKMLVIDSIKQSALPVILVCRTTLGTINHSLLSLEALRARDIPVAGIILSGTDIPHNRAAIEIYGKTRVIAHIPPLEPLDKAALLAIKPEVDLGTL